MTMKVFFISVLSLIANLGFASNDKDSGTLFANQPLISCNEGAYRMYESEIIKSDSLFRYSFNLYLNTWDEKKPSVYKSAKYPGNGTVKLLLFPDSGAFSMPCDNNLVTSHYGWRRGRMHRGTDVDLETGDEVRSVMDGVVRFAGWYSGYGYCVLIRHMNGLETLYAHLSKLEVKSGQVLNHGDKIGLGGTTGHSTGSHLHFEVHFMGRAINPELIFDFKKKEAKTDYLIVSSDGKARAYNPATASDSIEQTQSLTDDHDAETEAAEPVKQTQNKYHYVRKGETLYKLSRKYGTSVSALCRMNRIRSTTTLRIGQKLRVK
jgi:murein DD-endopeptidase MepM/ murein hydrolase activator NlpD